MKKRKVYLDYAAATPMDERVLKTMQPYLTDLFYNPSALYLDSKSVAEAITQARKVVAGWLGARPSEIVFTAGGTEANNLAIQGVMRMYPKANMLVSAIEHESVIRPADAYKCGQITVDAGGIVNIEDLKQKIDNQTVLVSIMYANNEIGTIEPIAQVAAVLNKLNKESQLTGNKLTLYFHTEQL